MAKPVRDGYPGGQNNTQFVTGVVHSLDTEPLMGDPDSAL